MLTMECRLPCFTRPAICSIGLLCLLVASGCGESFDRDFDELVQGSKLTGCAETDSCFANPTLEIGMSRPAQVRIPVDYTTTTRYPLMIVLHGYGANGALQSAYLGLETRVDSQQYILVVPDGTESTNGTRFWNATPACCARTAASANNEEAEQYTAIDDVQYLRNLIEEAAATYSIDYSRIGLIGHSNGGFMALRMACEASDIITSVVSLAGSTFAQATSCAPATNPVSVLALHGDADTTIFYEGSSLLEASYPGANETIRRFAAQAGCDTGSPIMPPSIDVIESIDGPESTVLAFQDCMAGAEVELWTIVDGPHIPFPWVDSALDSIVDWLVRQR